MHGGSLKIWLLKYQWIFIVNPASIPDWYYCCALRYSTSFSHTPGLGFGSEAAVSCYLTVVGSSFLLDVSYDRFSLLTKLLTV